MSSQRTVATVVAEAWNKPVLKQLPAPTLPSDGSHVRIKPLAVGVHMFVRARGAYSRYLHPPASSPNDKPVAGTNYSAKTLPHHVGIDGVGQLDDKSRVYFTTLAVGGGGFTEELVLPKVATWPLPSGADEVQVVCDLSHEYARPVRD